MFNAEQVASDVLDQMLQLTPEAYVEELENLISIFESSLEGAKDDLRRKQDDEE